MSKETNSRPSSWPNSWMEPILAQEIKRVQAPAGLWKQLRSAPAPQQRGLLMPRLAWAAATVALVTAVAVGGHVSVQKKAFAAGQSANQTVSQALTQTVQADGVRRSVPLWTAKTASVNVHATCHLCHSAADL